MRFFTIASNASMKRATIGKARSIISVLDAFLAKKRIKRMAASA